MCSLKNEINNRKNIKYIVIHVDIVRRVLYIKALKLYLTESNETTKLNDKSDMK